MSQKKIFRCQDCGYETEVYEGRGFNPGINIFFCDINNLLSYHFNTQLALDILPIYTIIDMIETAG